MDLFKEYMADVMRIKEGIPAMVKAILIENKDVVIGLLQDQLRIGEDKYGMSLHFHEKRGTNEVRGVGYYTEATERFWAARDFPIQPKEMGEAYNFEWSGDTFRMMDIDVKKEHFDIFSKTGKFNLLKKLYTVEAFELTEENNTIINEQMILPLLEEKLSDALADIV